MITEEMMAVAAAEMNEAMLRSLPEPEDCYHEFSAKFEKKMKRVIYRADHPLQFRILQKVASIILVLFLGFATIMAISPTVRASVFGWIREKYESFISYYYHDNSNNSISSPKFYLSELPSDYTETTSSFDEELGIFLGIYSNSNGDVLFLTYYTIPENANFFVEEEGYTIEQVVVNGNTADFYLANNPTDSNCIIWFDGSYNTVFYISGNLPKEEILFLANNVKRK